MTKVSLFKDWSWDKEMQVQILHSIDFLTTCIINSNRKKGSKKAEIPEFLRPDYVKKAIEQAKEEERSKNIEHQKELANYFEKRNAQMKEIEKQLEEGEEKNA